MKNLLPLALGALMFSCVSPYSISKMTPVASETSWHWGREFVQQTSRGVTVKVAYENNNRNFGIFNLEIVNDGAEPVLVAPEKFYTVLSGPNLPARYTQPQFARDPEIFFLELAKQTSRHAAQETNTAIRHTTSILTETATNVASLTTKETDAETAERRFSQEEAAYNRDVDDYNLQMAKLNLNNQKQLYDQTLLRKTTLPPNAFIYGQVYFPRHGGAAQTELVIPVNGELLKFTFKQTNLLP